MEEIAFILLGRIGPARHSAGLRYTYCVKTDLLTADYIECKEIGAIVDDRGPGSSGNDLGAGCWKPSYTEKYACNYEAKEHNTGGNLLGLGVKVEGSACDANEGCEYICPEQIVHL
jgi:hypothetical protein